MEPSLDLHSSHKYDIPIEALIWNSNKKKILLRTHKRILFLRFWRLKSIPALWKLSFYVHGVHAKFDILYTCDAPTCIQYVKLGMHTMYIET